MTSFDEVDELELVVRLVWQVVRQNSFPPPGPHRGWTEEAIIDQSVNLYLAKGGAVVAEARAAAGGDRGHLERRLLKTIRNYMIDTAKSTPVGLMRNRLATMLLRHPDFARLDGDSYPLAGWAQVGSPGSAGELWQGDEDALHAAAAATAVPATVIFNKSGPPPPATKKALLDVICSVFVASEGRYLPDQILARIVARRFDEFVDANNRDVAAYTSPADPETIAYLASPEPNTGDVDRVEAASLADWLWVEFSETERAIYPFLDIPDDEEGRVASVVRMLDCGEAEAKRTFDCMLDKIHEHADTVAVARHVLDELTAICNREKLNGIANDVPWLPRS